MKTSKPKIIRKLKVSSDHDGRTYFVTARSVPPPEEIATSTRTRGMLKRGNWEEVDQQTLVMSDLC